MGGPEVHLEIYESKFGKRMVSEGHRVEGQWVFGGFERYSGEIFMVPVEKRDRSTLLPIIEKWIVSGTTLHSDFWKAYNYPNDGGQNQLKVNHSIEFVELESGACTNHIEASWRAAKKHCDTGGCKKEFFGGYFTKYNVSKTSFAIFGPVFQIYYLASLTTPVKTTSGTSPTRPPQKP